MHSSKITLISDQIVSFNGKEINMHHINTIVVDENLLVVEVVEKTPELILQEEKELPEKLKSVLIY